MTSTSIAWNWLTFGISLIMIGVVLICINALFAYTDNIANTQIAAGQMTNQTYNVMQYAHSWLNNAPFIIIIIGFVACIIGAIDNKGSSP